MFIGYFPQDWILLLYIGAFCAAVLGVFYGRCFDIKSLKSLVILCSAALLLAVSSIVFDFQYLHKFSDNGETYPKPLYGCSDLEEYLETVPAFRNSSPSTWKDIIEQPECRSGAITTILFSCIIAWSSIFLLFAFLYLVLKLGFNRIRVPVKLGASIQNTEITPPNTDSSQAIPFEYTFASLDGDKDIEKLIKCIIRNICVGGDQQPNGWDGHVFREFIIQGYNPKRNSERKKVFKGGFKVEGEKTGKRVNITWTSFLGLKNRAPSEETTREILEWKAMCDEMPLRTLLGKFIVYYQDNGKNPTFLKEIKSIEEKFKSELK